MAEEDIRVEEDLFAEIMAEEAANKKAAEETVAEIVETAETFVAETVSEAEALGAETIGEEAVETAEELEEQAKPKRKLGKGLKAAIITLLAAALLVGGATVTKTITWFKNGVVLSNKEDLSIVLKDGELGKLSNFKNLKHVDLTGSENFAAIEAWAKEHPGIDVDYNVELPENATYNPDLREINFKNLSVVQALDNIESVQNMLKADNIRIDCNNWRVDQLEEFCRKSGRLNVVGLRNFKDVSVDDYIRTIAAAPKLSYMGTIALDENVAFNVEDGRPSMVGLSDEGFKQLDKLLASGKEFKALDFGTEEGIEHLEQIYNFMMDHPDTEISYKFTVFGRTHGIHASVLDFNHTKMTDQGETVRKIIPFMHNLKILDMDWANVDNEHMEKIREDFPDIEVEWRIWLGKYYSVRTDTEKIFMSAFGGGMLEDKDVKALKNCTKTKYMDMGHNENLTDASYIGYMPDLEVCILSITQISDISGFLNCPKLEYFEMFRSNITNLDALKNCKDLKHLNVARNPFLKDITGIYELDNLERFRIGSAYSTQVPRDQVAKFKELHPNTDVNDTVYHAHQYGWRENSPRYELLREQFGYGEDDSEYSYYWLDPQYRPHASIYTDEQLGLE